MSASPKVLLITGFRLFPSFTGGLIHTGSIARALARAGCEVQVFGLGGRREDYGRGESRKVEMIEPGLTETTDLGLFFGVLQSLARRLGLPRIWQYALLSLGWAPKGLRQYIAEADVVLADFPYIPPLPGMAAGRPWFLISHNLEHRLLEQGPLAERLFTRWVRQIEAAAPRRYRDIFPCAAEDREFYRQQPGGAGLQLSIVGSGVDPAQYERPAGTRERLRAELGIAEDEKLLIFSGSAFGPNLAALGPLKRFLREQQPWLAEHRLRVLLLGTMEPAPYREGVLIATGRVEDAVPYFLAADAGLNPVTTGSGANVKLFEYLATELPVISTPFGVRGTALEPGRDYVLYDPDEPQRALEQFLALGSREQCRAMAAAVWQRHRGDCDINLMVQRAVAALPEFSALAHRHPA